MKSDSQNFLKFLGLDLFNYFISFVINPAKKYEFSTVRKQWRINLSDACSGLCNLYTYPKSQYES